MNVDETFKMKFFWTFSHFEINFENFPLLMLTKIVILSFWCSQKIKGLKWKTKNMFLQQTTCKILCSDLSGWNSVFVEKFAFYCQKSWFFHEKYHQYFEVGRLEQDADHIRHYKYSNKMPLASPKSVPSFIKIVKQCAEEIG